MAFLGFFWFWMGNIKVARWNGINFLILKHMRKSKIGLLEQIWAKNPYVTFFLGHPVLIIQKVIKKSLSGYFLAYPPKMHYSAPQCSAMYCSVNASIIQSRWVKYDPWCPRMTDYGPGWHTRGQGGTRGSRGAPGGARGVQATPGAKMSDKTVK